MKEFENTEKTRKTCENCRWYQYSMIIEGYACVDGYLLTQTDWRMKYECCDKWEKKEK